jgi:hypothetical protein
VKAAVGTTGLITLLGEDCRASRVRENLMHGSYGEGLETGRCQAPRQSFTRQIFFGWWKRHLHVYHLIARTPYGVMVQMLAGLITYLLLAIYCHTEYAEKVSIRRVRELRIRLKNEAAMTNETEGDLGEADCRQGTSHAKG